MDRAQDVRRISLKLSEVLNDIGVNERVVSTRRKCTVFLEKFSDFRDIFIRGDAYGGTHYFGSQSEGSTTVGLQSDIDTLYYTRDFHVIQDWAEWKYGVMNLLMVRDETSPGYCLLQVLQDDLPLPARHVVNNDFLTDNKGRVLFKNTYANTVRPAWVTQQNGPAATIEGQPGLVDQDVVPALYCESWPYEGRDWLDRQCIGDWPPADIKRLAMSKGCFLVPVGSKCNNLDEVEWRISTSMAERLMMFNMNITQIRCYVMMKLISKTFFTMNGVSVITSFMCKCIVFHCIENTLACHWREDNLFACVMKCLSMLHECVQSLNCPHYIIPTNNLMAHRINADQQRFLLNVLSGLMHFNTDMFRSIKIDNLGQRLHIKLINLPSQVQFEVSIVYETLLNLHYGIGTGFNSILIEQKDKGLLDVASKAIEGIQNLQRLAYAYNDTAIEAYTYYVQLMCSFVGSILAAFSVYTNNTVSPDAIWWFSGGVNSDVSSSRLKLASAFYCAGDINNAELILTETDHKCTNDVVPLCACYPFKRAPIPVEAVMHLYRNEDLTNESFAYCVKFLRCEASIIPPELRQELFRSTEIEIQNRSHRDIRWMNFAVVDSLPYLYFLQYKVYKHKGCVQQQRKALSNLLKTILNVQNLGHRETAWNLLGQCMEQENMPVEARWCYQRSLEIRPHNNAANFHLTRIPRL